MQHIISNTERNFILTNMLLPLSRMCLFKERFNRNAIFAIAIYVFIAIQPDLFLI